MSNSDPTQINAKFSEVSEILRVQSLSHPNKVEIAVDAFDELLVAIKWLTTSAWGHDMGEQR